MHSGEFALVLRRGEPSADLVVSVLLKETRLGAIGGRAADRLPEGIPILAVVFDEIGGPVGEPSQGIAEDSRRLARLDAAKLDRAVVDALVGLVQRRR